MFKCLKHISEGIQNDYLMNGVDIYLKELFSICDGTYKIDSTEGKSQNV